MVVLRSVTTLRHGRGHGPKATVVANHGASQGECENISNEFQIYFETHFLLLETLLDRNNLTAHFLVKTNSRSEY